MLSMVAALKLPGRTLSGSLQIVAVLLCAANLIHCQSSSDSGTGPPSLMENWKISAQQHAEAIANAPENAKKLYSRITQDFEPWQYMGITQEMVEHAYCTDYARSFRLQIVAGQIYIVGENPGFFEFNHMTKIFILDAATRYQLPDIDVVISTADNCPDYQIPVFQNTSKCPYTAPVLSNGRLPWQKHCALYPAFSFSSGGWPMPFIPSWQSYLDLMAMERHNMTSWEERVPKLFFRGAPTGHRWQLFLDGTLNHARVDASLTSYTEHRKAEEHVSLAEHCNYRYLLHLPGHGYSARLKYLLLCGSPIIYYDNQMDEFYYHILEDQQHIYRVQAKDAYHDAVPLLHALRELEQDEAKAKQIGEAGRQIVEEVLTPDNVRRYFVETLYRYAALQTFAPQVHKDAVPFRHSVMSPDGKFTAWTRDCSLCTVDANYTMQASS